MALGSAGDSRRGARTVFLFGGVIACGMALACDCAPFTGATKAAARSDVAVVAKADAIRRETDPGGSELVARVKGSVGIRPDYGYDDEVALLAVLERFKGNVTSKIEVHAPRECGIGFERGVTYVVYATRKGSKLYTSMCKGT